MHVANWLVLLITTLTLTACVTTGTRTNSKPQALTSYHNDWVTVVQENGDCYTETWAVGMPGHFLRFDKQGNTVAVHFGYVPGLEAHYKGFQPYLETEDDKQFKLLHVDQTVFRLSAEDTGDFLQKITAINPIIERYHLVLAAGWSPKTPGKHPSSIRGKYGRPFTYDNIEYQPEVSPRLYFNTGDFVSATTACNELSNKTFTTQTQRWEFLFDVSRGTKRLKRFPAHVTYRAVLKSMHSHKRAALLSVKRPHLCSQSNSVCKNVGSAETRNSERNGYH